MRRFGVIGFILTLVVVGCAPQGPGSGASTTDGATQKPRTRLTTAINTQPRTVSADVNSAGGTGGGPGSGHAESMMNAGLTIVDKTGNRQPLLAEQTPTIENGLWRLIPGGGMEMTWKLRDGLRWHDGRPVTADDLIFNSKLYNDKEIVFFRTRAWDYVEGVDKVDRLTALVRFNSIYIDADTMFPRLYPEHLLGAEYVSNKAGLVNLQFWTHDFVGTGAYKLKEWQEGIQVTMEAYDNYVRGRPKIDEITVKFIPDSQTTIMANILAGAVDLTTDRGLSYELASQLAAQWPEGQVAYQVSGVEMLYPQHLNPEPQALGDVRFRRALFHALDRVEINQTLTGGMTPLAHSVENIKDRPYQLLEARNPGAIVKYDYDPRKSMQIMEEMGFRRGTDGHYSQPNGKRTVMDINATTGDYNLSAMTLAADSWRRIGLEITETPVPRQRQSDYEFRYGRTGFNAARGGGFLDLHTNDRPLPETNWTGGNKARYSHPEMDGLIDRYLTTLAMEPRMDIYAKAVFHVTDQLAKMPLVNVPLPTTWTNRLKGVDPDLPVAAGSGGIVWNIEQWELQ